VRARPDGGKRATNLKPQLKKRKKRVAKQGNREGNCFGHIKRGTPAKKHGRNGIGKDPVQVQWGNKEKKEERAHVPGKRNSEETEGKRGRPWSAR